MSQKSSKRIALAAIWLGTFTVGEVARKSNADAPAGFTSLFNGKDVSGWHGVVADPNARAEMSATELANAKKAADKKMRSHWTVVNGVLEFDGKGDSIGTENEYEDFEMYVDWKILPGGDSGVYLRGVPQVQIWDPDDPSLLKYGADKGSGGLWNNQKNERFPLVRADKQIGEWNTFYIQMVGDRVSVKLNDQLVVDNVVLENYWDKENPVPQKGSIELQNHGNKLWFRDIFVREISESNVK